MRETECPLCAAGDKPFKLKRRVVHHDPTTGRLMLCVDADLKPSA